MADGVDEADAVDEADEFDEVGAGRWELVMELVMAGEERKDQQIGRAHV